jgi:MerR family mercuric resistance operon transcriptional regulator
LGGIRRYGDTDTARIRFIKSAQKLGFSLDEVSTLLTLEDGTQCQVASNIAQQKLIEIRSKLANLRSMEKTLEKLVGECK